MSPATLSASTLTAFPGGDVGCDVQVTNPAAEEWALAVEIDGPAAEWAVVLPPALVLAPGGTGRARVTFTVPGSANLAGSTRQFVVRVGGAAAALPGRLDIADVRDLGISIHPLVTRARGLTTHTVTVENRGSRTERAALVAGDGAQALAFGLAEDRVTVAPGERATVAVTVTPRRRVLAGRARPHPFAVEVRPEGGSPVVALATRFQEPARWWPGAVTAALVLALAMTGGLVARSTGRTSTDRVTAGEAPAPTSSPSPACPAGGTAAESPVLSIAGFVYCPGTLTVAVGTEVAWTNLDLAPHTVTYEGPGGPVDSGSMALGQSWSTRFGGAGSFRYYCRFHPGMEGRIIVA